MMKQSHRILDEYMRIPEGSI